MATTGDGGPRASGGTAAGAAAARRRLRARRDELEGLRSGVRRGRGLEETQGQALSELSTYDNHPADLGTETWQRGQAVGMAADLDNAVAAVDAAIERVEAGTYGRCARCGRPIAPDRLSALPEARCCTACQEALDGDAWRGKPAPTQAEEAILAPPFAGAGWDGPDAVGFDAEDAWQMVARYGSSDTPADVPGAHYPEIVEDEGERHGGVEDVENLIAADGEPIPGVPENDDI